MGSVGRSYSVKTPAYNVLSGIGFALLAVACFAAMDTTTKHISLQLSLLMALWVRYAFQALATTAVVLPGRGFKIFYTAHPRYQLLRGLLLFCTSLLAFFSLKYMPVGEFTAIVMITPLVITLLAARQLKEKVSRTRWLLVCMGFVGTLVVIRPGGTAFDWGLILPLLLVGTNSAFQVLTSKMARIEDPITMHLYTGWVGALLATLILPWTWESPALWTEWAQMLLIGLLGTLGHFFLIMAYSRSPAATLTPYMYVQIGFATVGGWLVFNHVPDHITLWGMVLVGISGAIGAWLTLKESRVPVTLPES